MREIYVREAIEKGLADSESGLVHSLKEVWKKYGLPDGYVGF
jgi:predicted transcriptional regulator